LTDIVGAGNAALCLTRFEALAGLLLLVRGEDRLAAESDAVRLGVGPAASSAFEDAAALKLGGNAEDGEDDLGKVRGRVEVWLDQRPDTGPGALHLAGDNQKVGRIAREPVNGRGDHHVAGGQLLYQLAKLRPVGRGARDLLAEHLPAPGCLQFFDLSALVLGGGRDARIAVKSCFLMHQKSASKERNLFKAPIRCRFLQI